MAATTRVHAKGTLSATGTLSLGRYSDNWPYEPASLGNAILFSYVTTGAPATLSINFEYSQDGVTGWTSFSTLSSTTSASATSVASLTYPFIRANLTALTGGTNPTVVITVTTQNGN